MKALPLFIIAAASSVSPSLLQAQARKTVHEYIELHAPIAVQEMEQARIPASITLAQGIAESDYGNSELTRNSNNHFGIKCNKDWTGPEYYKIDDEATPSCFRVYPGSLASYEDHSKILTTRTRYKWLFDLSITDIEGWAHGLKRSGYATDSLYAFRLISLINRYDLRKYDYMKSEDFPSALMPVAKPYIEEDVDEDYVPMQFEGEDTTNAFNNQVLEARKRKSSPLFLKYEKGSRLIGSTTYFFSKEDEGSISAAKRLGISFKRFLRFNDLREQDELVIFQYVYIEPKQTIHYNPDLQHTVFADETMYEIAQYYGVKLQPLLERNHLVAGEEPARGERIYLGRNAPHKPRLTTDMSIPQPEPFTPLPSPPKVVEGPVVIKKEPTDIETPKLPLRQDLMRPQAPQEPPIVSPLPSDKPPVAIEAAPLPLLEDVPLYIDEEQPLLPPFVEQKKVEAPATLPAPVVQPAKLHKVVAGETLYSISRKYGVTVVAIQAANGMNSSNIRTNQDLVIPPK